MRKGKNVVGQSVISRYDGRKIDSVKDVLLGETNQNIVGLLIDEGGLLSSSRVVPIEAVDSFGSDAVVISGADAVISASSDPEIKAIVNRNEKLLGKRVLTNTGVDEGSISDMYFEEGTGRILGFEVSGGMLGDMARGTSFLPVEEIETIGSDVIFVRPEVGEDLENQVGGIQGALSDAGTKLREGAGQAGSDFQSGLGNLQSDVNQREPERGLLGRRSGSDITDESGSIIVANGQRIRAEHIQWARDTGNVGLLTRAAAAGEVGDTGARAGASLQQAGDNIGAMWDRFTARLAQQRDEDGRVADEQQTRSRISHIADAIGRPVGKVILDREDNVILDFGDIITHASIQRAYDAGQLDTLLGAVYRAEFGLPLDRLRANQPASATVSQASGGATIVEELEQRVQETERERAERQERERREAETAAQQREREREERARAREREEQERQREIEEARATEAELEAAESREPTAVGPGTSPSEAQSSARMEADTIGTGETYEADTELGSTETTATYDTTDVPASSIAGDDATYPEDDATYVDPEAASTRSDRLR